MEGVLLGIRFVTLIEIDDEALYAVHLMQVRMPSQRQQHVEDEHQHKDHDENDVDHLLYRGGQRNHGDNPVDQRHHQQDDQKRYQSRNHRVTTIAASGAADKASLK